MADGATHAPTIHAAVTASPLVITCLTGFDDTRKALETAGRGAGGTRPGHPEQWRARGSSRDGSVGHGPRSPIPGRRHQERAVGRGGARHAPLLRRRPHRLHRARDHALGHSAATRSTSARCPSGRAIRDGGRRHPAAGAHRVLPGRCGRPGSRAGREHAGAVRRQMAGDDRLASCRRSPGRSTPATTPTPSPRRASSSPLLPGTLSSAGRRTSTCRGPRRCTSSSGAPLMLGTPTTASRPSRRCSACWCP